MRTGFLSLGGKTYYFGKEMKTGLVKVNGKWYYFNSKGVMQVNCKIKIGKKNYYFAKNGTLTKVV